MNEYKKLGHKKPGLWTGDFFVFFFVGESGLEDKPDWLRKLLFLSTLLFSSPPSESLMSRMAGWDGTMTGQDNMRLLGQDDMKLTIMRLPCQDKMGWDKKWMMVEMGQ